jgi:hypothetical protein
MYGNFLINKDKKNPHLKMWVYFFTVLIYFIATKTTLYLITIYTYHAIS